VGLLGGGVGLVLAVARERSRRARSGGRATAHEQAPVVYPPGHGAAGTARREQQLDEELAQTFPASDPLPHSHRVD
jgi:hypothetical protein